MYMLLDSFKRDIMVWLFLWRLGSSRDCQRTHVFVWVCLLIHSIYEGNIGSGDR